MKKIYDEKFKEDSCKYYLSSGKSLDVAAENLGIGKSTLFKWVQIYKNGNEYKQEVREKKKATVSADKQKIRELEKEIRELEEVNRLLKKSMAIFCKDLDKVTSL